MALDWVTNIKSIYHNLDTNGLHHVAFEIGEEHVKGGTPGEMFTLLVHKLIEIKSERPEVYADPGRDGVDDCVCEEDRLLVRGWMLMGRDCNQ